MCVMNVSAADLESRRMTYGQDKHGVPKGLTEDAGFLGDQPFLLIYIPTVCSSCTDPTLVLLPDVTAGVAAIAATNDTRFHRVCCIAAGYKNWLPFARTK
jgi:hypothetical protein